MYWVIHHGIHYLPRQLILIIPRRIVYSLASIANALTSIFGDNYQFTDHTYDGIGMAPQNYN